MSEKLLPCPCCGNEEIESSIYGIWCKACTLALFGKLDESFESMCERWNTRTESQVKE